MREYLLVFIVAAAMTYAATPFVRWLAVATGAITAVRGGNHASLEQDPFARIFAGELVEVGCGLLGRTPQPTGPAIQRYGGSEPWPWDEFAG